MIYTLVWLDCKELVTEVLEDDKKRKVIEELQQGNNDKASTGFTYKCRVFLYKGRLVVGESSHWIPRLLEECLASP